MKPRGGPGQGRDLSFRRVVAPSGVSAERAQQGAKYAMAAIRQHAQDDTSLGRSQHVFGGVGGSDQPSETHSRRPCRLPFRTASSVCGEWRLEPRYSVCPLLSLDLGTTLGPAVLAAGGRMWTELDISGRGKTWASVRSSEPREQSFGINSALKKRSCPPDRDPSSRRPIGKVLNLNS